MQFVIPGSKARNHDMRMLGRVLCAGGTCLAPTGVKRRCESTKYGTIRKVSLDISLEKAQLSD